MCVWSSSSLKVPTQFGSFNGSKLLDLISRKIQVAEKALIFTLYWELSSSNSHLNFQSKAFVCNSIPFFKARNGQKGRFLIISYPSNSYFLHASSSDSLFHISWHDQNNCTRFIFTRISLISNFRTFTKQINVNVIRRYVSIYLLFSKS